MSVDVMQQALEALETNNKAWKSLADSGDAGWWEAEEQPFYEISVKAINALRQAIEQAEQAQPVAWMHNYIDGNIIAHKPADIQRHPERWTQLYAAPPPRKPLTDEELAKVCGFGEYTTTSTRITLTHLARAIEQAHGIKGEA